MSLIQLTAHFKRHKGAPAEAIGAITAELVEAPWARRGGMIGKGIPEGGDMIGRGTAKDTGRQEGKAGGLLLKQTASGLRLGSGFGSAWYGPGTPIVAS